MSNSAQSSKNPDPFSSSKRQKLSDSTEQNTIDRISQLPDFVLSHILSFLPTKIAVSTSILSKRWKFLWTCVLNVDLDDNTVVPETFEDVVCKVLRLRKRECPIKKFSLLCEHGYDVQSLDTWVCVAVASKVEELDFRLNSGYCRNFEFPSSIFSCKTLVVLKLTCIDILINVPSSVHLPNLKVLHLIFIQYEDDHSVRNLFTGCPVLEDVHVGRGDFDNVLDYEISSPTLRNLVLDFISSDVVDEYDTLSRINTVHLKNLCNLVQANLNLYPYHELEYESYINSVDVLRAVCNVKFLELSEYTTRALHYAPCDGFPLFHNLIKLKLDGFCCFWDVLQNLLDKSPCLEHLTLGRGSPPHYRHVCEECECWTQPPDVPKCLSFQLKTFCFEELEGSEDDMECARYILENSLVLENMEINYWRTIDLIEQLAIQHKLEMFGRGSNKCQLKFAFSQGLVNQ